MRRLLPTAVRGEGVRPVAARWAAGGVVLALGLVAPRAASPQVVNARPPETWALLIGIDRYSNPDVTRAKYSDLDAEALAGALRFRGGVPKDHIVVMVNGSPDALQPTRVNIMAEARKLLARAGEDDRVILFFSGHGFLSRDTKRSYLAPIEADRSAIEATLLPLSEFRKLLEECKSKSKFLILDACHAGNVKGDSSRLTFKAMGLELKDMPSTYTLASCQADESSTWYDEKKNGLFTHFLVRGLEGAADDNGDGRITADELFQFVSPQVQVIGDRLGVKQTPARIVGPRVPVTDVIQLRPEPQAEALDRLADLVREQVLRYKVGKLGVVEFRRDPEGSLGTFGLGAAGRVSEALKKNSGTAYSVLDRLRVQNAARDVPLGGPDRPEALQKLAANDPDVKAVLTGSVQALPDTDPDRLRLSCRLWNLTEGTVLATVTTVIKVDAVVLSQMNGLSGKLRRAPEPGPSSPVPLPIFVNPRAGDLSGPARESHPAFQKDFPFKLEIRAPGGPAKPVLRDPGNPNTAYVEAAPGERFEILIVNDLKNPDKTKPMPVLVKLFAGGLNVLGRRPEPPEAAWPWFFPGSSRLAIEGWHLPKGPPPDPANKEQAFDVDPFVFSNPREALAPRQSFGEDTGQITAYFYEARPMAWIGKLGVDADESRRIVKTYPTLGTGCCQGRLLAVITLHYGLARMP